MLIRAAKFGIAICTLLLAGTPTSRAQADKATGLSVVRAPELVRCTPISMTPCLSVIVTPSNSAGQPVPVALPTKGQLLQAVQVDSNGETVAPFYVSAGASSDASRRANIVLIEVDISGSMNTPVSPGVSRFEAARTAIAKYVDSMQEGVDQIAIVPFESHHVVPTIRAAVFTSNRNEAMAQLKAMPQPAADNNTALFQAVFSGIQAMQAEMSTVVKPGTTASDFQPRVIVMTDGKNEVARGDDPDLLDGPLGMQQAIAKVASSGLDVIGIGFGDRSQIDTQALQRLSKRMYLATTGDQLIQIFHATTPLQNANLQVTFLSPWADRPSISSRDPQFSLTLTLPDGHKLMSPLTRYVTPAMSTPLYQRSATPEEMAALIAARPAANSGWDAVLRGLLVFAGCGVLLLLLWIWVPRLIWGNEDMSNLASTGAGRRWGKDTGVKASAVQMRTVANAPDGFDAEQLRSKQQRSAGQITQVQPRTEYPKAEIVRDTH